MIDVMGVGVYWFLMPSVSRQQLPEIFVKEADRASIP